MVGGLLVLGSCGWAHAQATSQANNVWELGLGLGVWGFHGGGSIPEAVVRASFPSRSRSQFEMVLGVPLGSFPEEGDRTVFYSLQGRTPLRHMGRGARLFLTWGAMGYFIAGSSDRHSPPGTSNAYFLPPLVGFIGVALDRGQRFARMRFDGQYVVSPLAEGGWSATRMSAGMSFLR